ncbi:MAG: hypothetical protein ACRD2E_15040 [Terriglobales bacterium]
MRWLPPPGLLAGIEAAHAPLRRTLARARRLGLPLMLLRLRFATRAAPRRGTVESFLPRLSAELRATDLAWQGRQRSEWLVLLEATAEAGPALRRWQAAARQWGLELQAWQVEFPQGGLTLSALLAALGPEPDSAQPQPAAGEMPAASGSGDGD